MPVKESIDTFKYFDKYDAGAYITWYKLNRKKLIKRLLTVQSLSDIAKRNAIMFDQWLTTDTGIKKLHKEHGTSKSNTRVILNKQLMILHKKFLKESVNGKQD